jgi:SAM-dependent methyltransferase
MKIARDKAAAVGADVDFSMLTFEDDVFEIVLADASLIQSAELKEFLIDAVRVVKPGGRLAAMMITAGSFGEIFSLLWEVLFNEDLGQHGSAAEKLIADQPTVSQIEETAETTGLVNVKTHTAIEVFEYDDGPAFIASPLVSDFLIPKWLETLSEDEKEQVTDKLAQLIDAEDADLTFRFSVKATLLTGEKV